MSECELHNDIMNRNNSEIQSLKNLIHNVNKSLSDLSVTVNSLLRIEMDDKLKTSVSLIELVKETNNLVKDNVITNEKVIRSVENNLEPIVNMTDEFRAARGDKNAIRLNNKFDLLKNILFYLSFIVNIIMFIHFRIKL